MRGVRGSPAPHGPRTCSGGGPLGERLRRLPAPFMCNPTVSHRRGSWPERSLQIRAQRVGCLRPTQTLTNRVWTRGQERVFLGFRILALLEGSPGAWPGVPPGCPGARAPAPCPPPRGFSLHRGPPCSQEQGLPTFSCSHPPRGWSRCMAGPLSPVCVSASRGSQVAAGDKGAAAQA